MTEMEQFVKVTFALALGMFTTSFCAAKAHNTVATTQAAFTNYENTKASAEHEYSDAIRAVTEKYMAVLNNELAKAMKQGDLDAANQISTAKKEMEKTIVDANVTLPRTIDLMPYIDLRRDEIGGHWQINNGKLYSDANRTRVEIAYAPPQEYNFIIDFARLMGDQSIMQICAEGRVQFYTTVAWGTTGRFAGIGTITGLGPDQNPTGQPMDLINHQEHEAVVRVRKDEVQYFIDGKLIGHYTTDYKDMSLPEERTLHDTTALGLDTWESPSVFYKVQLVEISGRGHEIK